MARARATYLSEREKDFLHEKTLEVLEKVGVAYNTPQAIDLLASAGAEVDRDALTAKLTWDIIEPCLKTAPKKVLLAGRRPEDDRVLGEWPLHTTTDGIQTYVYDDLTGRRREGGHFLGARSTRQFYRAGELWQAQLWHRESFEHYVDTPLVKDAWDRAHELIEKNDVPPLPEDVQRHVDALIVGYLRSRG